jgi:hypothetical protein
MRFVYRTHHYRTYYDRDETVRLFAPLVDKIFVDRDDPDHLKDGGSKLFRAPTWKAAPFGAVPWGSGGRHANPGDRRDVVQYDALTDGWYDTRPWLYALAERGTHELIHMAPFRRVNGEFYETGALVTLPLDNMTQVYMGEDVVLDFGCIVSREADWGVVGDVDHLGIVGGAPAFMDRVFELGGGEAYMKQVFDDIWINEGLDMSEGLKRYALSMYACAKWEPPRELVEWAPE